MMLLNKKEASNLKKNKLVSSVVIVILVFALFLFASFVLWYTTRSKAFDQISENSLSKAEYYANEIEIRSNRLEFGIEQLATSYDLELDNADPKIKEDIEFYIQNYDGLDEIIITDNDFIIKSVISNESGNKYINKSIKDIDTYSENDYVFAPFYIDNELNGFVFGRINIIKMIQSISREEQLNYEIIIVNDNNTIYMSDNWEMLKDNFTQSISINLKDSSMYELSIKPTIEFVDMNTRHISLILIFGSLFSLIIAIVMWISIRLKFKSSLLVKAQKELLSKKNELETKNKVLQKQIRNQQKLESIGTLASGVAHEINNPINGVMNYSQLIMDASEADSENILYSKEIISETKRISDLVSNILQFSRQGKENFSNARIEDIIGRSVSLVRTILKKDQIELQSKVDDNLPDIKCRSQEIQQVLMNLLINARDSLNDKYVEYNEDKVIIISAKKSNSNNKEWLQIIVEDHGKGIPMSIQSKIFKQFFTTKDIGKGTGLGLAISYDIIKEHNGEIRIESEEGLFARFIVSLPCDI